VLTSNRKNFSNYNIPETPVKYPRRRFFPFQPVSWGAQANAG